MLLVGLTGNIGSGKSTVAQLLSERGATIIDADVLARRAVELGTTAYASIVERWGTSILAADGFGANAHSTICQYNFHSLSFFNQRW